MSQAVKRLIAASLIGGAAVGATGCGESASLEQLGANGAAVVSTGFTDEAIASGITSPTAMTVAPDGRVFVSQQAGQLRVITNANPPQLLATPFLTVSTTLSGERGLIGVAFDPDFAVNRFLYVFYTSSTPAPHNRVSRFTASASNPNVVEAGSEVVLLELDDLSSSVNHNGGAIHFGPDGKLYVAVGDNLDGDNAQAPTNLFGKVLRINPDGSIPIDNPFLDQTSGVYGSIWAIGLRNPFTFAFQRGTGRMFINDVGESTWEEIDDGIAGANYGWPQTEGATTQAGLRGPLFAYGHGRTTTTGCAITGGAFYNPITPQFPSTYLGKYFFADYCSGWIRVLDPSSGTATGFATGLTSPIDLQVTDDGALWYLQHDGINNTIVNNDSTATSPDSFGGDCETGVPPGQYCPPPPVEPGGLANSIPQVAGIGSQLTSSGLQAAMAASPVPAPNKQFSNPTLQDNIVYGNRSFWWNAFGGPLGLGAIMPRSTLPGSPSDYWDFAVYTPSTNYMDPEYSVLSTLDRGDGTFFSATNTAADPQLSNTYYNTYQATSKGAALGNFVEVAFNPLGLRGDPHLTSGSPARGVGGGVYVATVPVLQLDYDLASRPTGTTFDAGAAQFVSAPADTADLSITDVGSPQGIIASTATPITYTVVVTNHGPSTANGVSASVAIPAGATGVSASSTQGAVSVSASSVGVSIGNMTYGTSATILVHITMASSAPFSSTATVSSSSPADPNLINNSATANTSINGPLGLLPVQNFKVVSSGPAPNGSGIVTLNWDPPSFGQGCTSSLYDVLRSPSAADFVTSATCVATDLTVTTATDSDLTPMNPGEVRYYIIRDHNDCGSNMGTASDGTPRQGRSCS